MSGTEFLPFLRKGRIKDSDIFAFFAPWRETEVLEPEKLKEMGRKDLSRNLVQYSMGPITVKSMKEIRAI